jgi:hypothetical protein
MAMGLCDGQLRATQAINKPQISKIKGWIISIGEYSLVPNWSLSLTITCSLRLPGKDISSCVNIHVMHATPKK